MKWEALGSGSLLCLVLCGSALRFAAGQLCSGLCSDGSLPEFPDVVVQIDPFPPTRCAEIQNAALGLPVSICPALQVVGWSQCGCPELPTDLNCPLCPEGVVPPDAGRLTGFDLGGDELTCGLAQAAAVFNETLCEPLQGLGEVCCSANPPPSSGGGDGGGNGGGNGGGGGGDDENLDSLAPTAAESLPPTIVLACESVCADGSDVTVPNLNNVAIPGNRPRNSVRCGDLSEQLATADANSCNLIQTIGFVRCDCPTMPMLDCPLCLDDSVPMEFDAVVSMDGDTEVTCASLLFAVANTTDPDTCEGSRLLAEGVCCPSFPSISPSAEGDMEAETPSPTVGPTETEGSDANGGSGVEDENGEEDEDGVEDDNATNAPTAKPSEAPVAPTPRENQSTTSDARVIAVSSVLFRIVLLISVSLQVSWSWF